MRATDATIFQPHAHSYACVSRLVNLSCGSMLDAKRGKKVPANAIGSALSGREAAELLDRLA
jgi:hypothetical protein